MTQEETFDAVVQRLMPIWRLRAQSQAEPLMRLINCLESREDVNLSGIERDLIVYALAAALRSMPLQDHAHTDRSIPCPTCGFHVVERQREPFVYQDDDDAMVAEDGTK